MKPLCQNILKITAVLVLSNLFGVAFNMWKHQGHVDLTDTNSVNQVLRATIQDDPFRTLPSMICWWKTQNENQTDQQDTEEEVDLEECVAEQENKCDPKLMAVPVAVTLARRVSR